METDSALIDHISQLGNSVFQTWVLVLNIGIILFSTIISVLLSGAEIALFIVAQGIRTKSEDQLNRYLRIIHRWFENPDYLRTSLKVTGGLFRVLLIALIVKGGMDCGLINNLTSISTVLYIIGLALLYVIIIEIFPKSLASAHPEKVANFGVYCILVLFSIFQPVIKLVHWLKIHLNGKVSKQNLNIELSNAISGSSDVFTDEVEIVKGIVKFGNIDVSQILRPRVDVVAVDYSNKLKEVLEVVVESGYSRIPVYNGNFDNVKGVLYVKDLLPFIHNDDSFKWQSLIRPPYFVPESKKVNELLNEFKANKIHMAVIVDEYGGTLGIATLEDILEEIVGEISDESDEDERFYTKINDFTFVFDAKILLNDFYKIIQCEPDVFTTIKGDADTLAGLILELKGEIPTRNEEISYKNFNFKIEAVDSRRIKQIRVSLLDVNNPDTSSSL